MYTQTGLEGPSPVTRRTTTSYEQEGLELAPTTTNKINVDLLARDSADLADIYAPIRDPDAFAALLQPDPEDDGGRSTRKHRPLSRGMLVHAPTLEAYEVVEPTAPHMLELGEMAYSPLALAILTTVWCVCFLVPKKNRTQGRFVTDCRPINRRMARAPPMELPPIGTFVRSLLSADVAAKTDGKSYFYQFALPRRIRRFFKCRLAGRRGRYKDVQLARLPMGWSWSPAIAQHTSNFLVRGCGLAWLDDFLIFGSRKEFTDKKNTFLERLQKYNVEVDDLLMEPVDHLKALGLEFDLKNKRYRVDPAWVEKRRDKWLATLRCHQGGRPTTIRDLLEVFGSLIWTSYVLEEPLWMHAEALAALSHVAKTAARHGFDHPMVLPEYCIDDVQAWIDEISAVKWHTPAEKPLEFEEFVFSDASDTVAAFIRVVGKDIVDGDAWLRDDKEHIFLGELEAACAAAPAASGDALYATDNKVLHYVLRRGHSSVYTANVRLRATFGARRPWSCWVPTDIQPGDKYTRGVKLPSFPLPASSDPEVAVAKQFINQHDANGVPISKRNIGTPPLVRTVS